MTLLIERIYPYVLAVGAGVAWWHYQVPFSADAKELLGAALSMASILTGFLATAKAILISVQDARVIQDLQRSGHYRVLIGYVSESILALFVFCLWNIVGFFVTRDPWFCILWTAMGTLAAASFVRVMYALMCVLKHVKPASATPAAHGG